MKKSTAKTISRAIQKECQRFSLEEWCKEWNFTVDEFYEFLEIAIDSIEKESEE